MVLQTCASDGGLKTFFCRLGLGISPAGIVADAISAMAAVASQLFENRSAAPWLAAVWQYRAWAGLPVEQRLVPLASASSTLRMRLKRSSTTLAGLSSWP